MELDQLRIWYEKAVQDGDDAEQFWKRMADYRGLHGATLGYKAAARALLARYAWNPYNKLTYLKESMALFRKAVRLDPQNIEIRFLRFAIQHYIPGFLDQSENLEEDKDIMSAHLHRYADFDLKEAHAHTFIRFFEESGRFEEEELASLRQQLS